MLGLAPIAAVPALASKPTPNEYLSEVTRKSDAPFTFDDGISRMDVANIGHVEAGLIRSSDGRLHLDLPSGQMIFR